MVIVIRPCIIYIMLLRHNFLITLCWILSLQKIVIINLWSKFATTKLYWEYNIVTRLQLLTLAQEAHKSFDQDYRLASNCKWIFNNVSLIFLPATYSFIYQLQILPIVENNFSHCQFHRGNNRLGVPHSSPNRIHLSETWINLRAKPTLVGSLAGLANNWFVFLALNSGANVKCLQDRKRVAHQTYQLQTWLFFIALDDCVVNLHFMLIFCQVSPPSCFPG